MTRPTKKTQTGRPRPASVHAVAKTTTADAIYDPFVGSGSALIAAEKTNRSCLAMDVDPQYVEVTLRRWEQFTGQTAVKVSGRRSSRRKK